MFLTAVVLVGVASCSDDGSSAVDRWRENGLLAGVPGELVRALQAERSSAVAEAIGAADVFSDQVAWSDAVERTDAAMSALDDGITGDEVAEDIYTEAISELDRLEDIRSVVADEVESRDAGSGGFAFAAGEGIEADYTAVIGVVLDAGSALAREVDDVEIALGIGLYIAGLRQTETLATVLFQHQRAYPVEGSGSAQAERDLADSIADLEAGPSWVVEHADGTVHHPAAANVESAVGNSNLDEVVAAQASGELIEREALVAVRDDLGRPWHAFVTEVEMRLTYDP